MLNCSFPVISFFFRTIIFLYFSVTLRNRPRPFVFHASMENTRWRGKVEGEECNITLCVCSSLHGVRTRGSFSPVATTLRRWDLYMTTKHDCIRWLFYRKWSYVSQSTVIFLLSISFFHVPMYTGYTYLSTYNLKKTAVNNILSIITYSVYNIIHFFLMSYLKEGHFPR